MFVRGDEDQTRSYGLFKSSSVVNIEFPLWIHLQNLSEIAYVVPSTVRNWENNGKQK